MRIRSLPREQKKARIEIIPMIDTMFFLLVFFMVATLSMTVMRGVPVNLPKSETAGKDIRQSLTVSLEKGGAVYCDKEQVTQDGLRNILKAESGKNPDLLVILNADEDVPHGKVVGIIDEVKLAGITKFAIATKPR